MRVIRGWSTDSGQPATDPFRKKSGVFVEFRGGDICHPRGAGDWFKPPYFTSVFRYFLKYPIFPYVTWRLGDRGGYAGAKIYGVDSPAYRNWLPEQDVYEGSQAIMLSVRPFANLKGE